MKVYAPSFENLDTFDQLNELLAQYQAEAHPLAAAVADLHDAIQRQAATEQKLQWALRALARAGRTK